MDNLQEDLELRLRNLNNRKERMEKVKEEHWTKDDYHYWRLVGKQDQIEEEIDHIEYLISQYT